jgi:hypothetical protein
VPRRFALDQNFPEPIVDGLVDWLASDAELMPIRRIDERLATLDDWEVLQALHAETPGHGTRSSQPTRRC